MVQNIEKFREKDKECSREWLVNTVRSIPSKSSREMDLFCTRQDQPTFIMNVRSDANFRSGLDQMEN